MAIGSLGDIVFEVSDDHVLTPKDMNYQVGARYSTHNRLQKRPLEYEGPDLDTYSLTITLSTFFGIYPRKNMYKLNEACRKGTPLRLVIGKTHFGKYKWVITNQRPGEYDRHRRKASAVPDEACEAYPGRY